MNNQIHRYAKHILKDEKARIQHTLRSDLEYLFNEGGMYIPGWLCSKNDHSLFERLQVEIENDNAIQWSRHYKFENPEFSSTFKEIVHKLSEFFQVDVLATRLNYYPDGSSWKPFHHDSHAFSNGQQEDFTMGVSLGHSRSLAFKHPESQEWFQFPQENGDVFAFNSEVNRRFMHGVPKTHDTCGPRFSIIAWGRRRIVPILSDANQVRRPNRLREIIRKRNYSAVQSGWNT